MWSRKRGKEGRRGCYATIVFLVRVLNILYSPVREIYLKRNIFISQCKERAWILK